MEGFCPFGVGRDETAGTMSVAYVVGLYRKGPGNVKFLWEMGNFFYSSITPA